MDKWLNDFDGFMKQFFGIDSNDAGVSEERLIPYRNLPPREAALEFGEEYDLDRIDRGWFA